MKRVLSMVLSLLMIVSIIPLGTMNVSAASLDSRVEAAIQWAISIANDNSHGYSQANRNGPDYDCSSFVSTAFKNGGFAVSGSLHTGNMLNAFVSAGFTKYNKGAVTLQRGDILLRPKTSSRGGHTELYIGNNQCVAAHSNHDGKTGDSGGKEINIRSKNYCTFCKNSDYTYVLRYEGSSNYDSYTYSFNFNANGGTLGSSGAFSVSYGDQFQVLNTTCTRSGYTWAGWTVKRNNDNKWYVDGQGWCTESQISSNGYIKKTYPNYKTLTLDESWTSGITGNCSYTFYAIWIQSRVDTLKVFLSPYGEGYDHITALNNLSSSGFAQDQIYAWYILYDGNTGELMNTYSDKTYSVELAIHDPNGELVFNYTYTDSSDANWIGVTPQMSGTYTATATISGAYSGSISTTYEVSYDTELSSSHDSISLNLNGTNNVTPTVYISGSHPGEYGVRYQLGDSSIASATWTGNWNGNSTTIAVTGKKYGSTNLTISVYENYTGNKNVVASMIIPIYVSANSYTISYNANGGSGAPSSQTKYYGTDITLSSTVPTRSGYSFLGWSTSSTATSATYQPGSTFSSNANTTLYAVWKADATALSVNSTSIARISPAGTTVYYTFTPSVSGKYVIYSAGDLDGRVYLYNSSGTLLDNDDDGGEERNFRLEYNMVAGTTYRFGVNLYDSSLALPIVFRFGKVYTISYDANGGSGAPSVQSKDYAKDITLSSTVPTRSGYTFLGWDTSSTATSATYQPGAEFSVDENTTLYAVWQVIPTTLSVNSTNSAVISIGGEMKYFTYTPTTSGTYVIYSTGSDDTKVYLYSADGTEMDNDDDDGDGTNFRLEYNLTAGTEYTFGVRYYNSSKTGTISFKFGNVYTVTYNANGGSGTPSAQSKDYGTSITLSSSTPTRTGYTFLGWATSSTATSATYQAGSSFSNNSNTTLYAVWKANTYTISYNANGGSGAPSNQVKTYGVSLTLSSTVPIRTGYTFLGWATSSTATSATYQPGSSFTSNANTTLYAVWKANTYTISYNANGGSGTMSNSSHTYDVSKVLSTNVYTRSGYTFIGWATSSSATTPAYTNSQSVKNLTSANNATVVLYAVWEQGCGNGTHSYSYTTTKAPTTSATGTLTGTCSKCSGTTIVTLPKLSTTDYSYSVRTAATCTVSGSGRYTWKTTTYGSFYFDVSISATGHNYSNGSCTHCGADDPNYVTSDARYEITDIIEYLKLIRWRLIDCHRIFTKE